jgi:hypothetical protein
MLVPGNVHDAGLLQSLGKTRPLMDMYFFFMQSSGQK